MSLTFLLKLSDLSRFHGGTISADQERKFGHKSTGIKAGGACCEAEKAACATAERPVPAFDRIAPLYDDLFEKDFAFSSYVAFRSQKNQPCNNEQSLDYQKLATAYREILFRNRYNTNSAVAVNFSRKEHNHPVLTTSFRSLSHFGCGKKLELVSHHGYSLVRYQHPIPVNLGQCKSELISTVSLDQNFDVELTARGPCLGAEVKLNIPKVEKSNSFQEALEHHSHSVVVGKRGTLASGFLGAHGQGRCCNVANPQNSCEFAGAIWLPNGEISFRLKKQQQNAQKSCSADIAFVHLVPKWIELGRHIVVGAELKMANNDVKGECSVEQCVGVENFDARLAIATTLDKDTAAKFAVGLKDGHSAIAVQRRINGNLSVATCASFSARAFDPKQAHLGISLNYCS